MSSHTTIYRSIWRWHFYAGLVVAPILLTLAITGAIYLFNDEINDVLHRETRFSNLQGADAPLSKVATAARDALPGSKVTRIDTPTSAGRTYQVFVTPADGKPLRVFVDPVSARVLGSYVYTETLVGFADVTHGSLMLGDFGDAIVELSACWGLILAVTGLYLWWPRGQVRLHHALYPRAELKGRRFVKSLHASIGAWTALLMIFLIISGLPWATVWGGLFRSVINSAGVGYPASFRTHGAPVSSTLTVKDVAEKAAPWTIDGMPAPTSDPHAGHAAGAPNSMPVNSAPIGLDDVARIISDRGAREPYRLSLPQDAVGTYSAFTYPDQPEGQRTLYIDQYSGKIIGDVGFEDYGLAAKAVELGVQIHMGNYFGRLNQIIMLVPCIGIVVLAITGPYMWWQRRPMGAIAAPQSIAPPKLRTLALIIVAMGAFFPLAGASLVAVMLFDWLVAKLTARPIDA